MLLSRSQRFLFVHIQKTAGSSLRAALQAAMPDLAYYRGTHDHAEWARWDLGGQWDSLFKSAFVRNPWERLVSWWCMIREQPGTNRFWEYVRSRASTFEEFLDRCTDTVDDDDGRKSILFNQLDYLADADGRLLVDFVGRFERLKEDAGQLFARLGLPAPALPHINSSEHQHYSAFYSERTRMLVAERYRRDIAHFGYAFAEGPAKVT